MLKMPDYYVQVDAMPEDPENSVPMCAQSNSANIFTIAYPIDVMQAMPFENPQLVIDGIHEALSDDQGLIEVGSGYTKADAPYIYSIVKTKMEPTGVQYILTYQIREKKYAVNLQGFFDEAGVTGQRDAMIYAALQNQGLLAADLEGWMKDPYDPDYSRGLLMNLSEQVQYDEAFPEHPLSMARELVHFLNDNN